MVIEREREIRGLTERLREANERHERSIVSLDAVSERLEEIAGPGARPGDADPDEGAARGGRGEPAHPGAGRGPRELGERRRAGRRTGQRRGRPAASLFEGLIKLEIGPLGDFSQLVGFEDAVGRLGASEISVERFSEGRATLSMQLDEPVDLLRELEEHSPFDFNVRRTADDNLVLDVDEDQDPEQRAA